MKSSTRLNNILSYSLLVLAVLSVTRVSSQTNAPSIQTGASFQWSVSQPLRTDPAVIQSITVNGRVYLNFGVPTAYELTQLGPNGHNPNGILENGTYVETASSSATWNASALSAFQDNNLNHYFEANGNGQNICDNFTAENTTTSQRQTLTYNPGIKTSSSALLAVTERNANNCYHIELFGIPAGGGPEQSLGETFVNEDSTQWGYGGTGTSGTNLGTPGTVNPPSTGSDYWLTDRVHEIGSTIGVALFLLDDIAPIGSTITKAQLTAGNVDHADGKIFIMTFPDEDGDGLSDPDDLDDDDDGILDIDEANGNFPDGDEDADGIPNWNDTVDNGTGDGSTTNYLDSNGDGVPDVYDFDGDGIPNHKDFDSDNDGCFDALEGDGGVLPSQLDGNGVIDITVNGVDVNGVPNDVSGGQADVSSTNIIVGGPQCDDDNDGVLNVNDLCNGFDDTADNDSDSIPDGCDQDDDNDGILDNVECGNNIATSNQDFEFNNTHVYTVAENNTGNAIANSLWPTDINTGNYSTSTISDWSFVPSGNTRGIGLVYTHTSGNMTLSVIPDHEAGNGGIFSTTSSSFVSGTSGNAMGFRPGDSSLDDDYTNRIVLEFAEPTHGVAFNLNDIFDQGSGSVNDADTQLQIFVNGTRVLYTDMEEPFANGATGTKTIHGEDGTDLNYTLGEAQEFGIGFYNNITGISSVEILYSVQGPPASGGNSESWGFDNLNWLTTNCIDTDNDTIPDYLELDSDADGCSDALESGATTNATSDYQFPSSPVGTDGIPDAVQATSGANSGNVDYTVIETNSGTYDFQDINVNVACIADLSLTKTIDNATPKIGETITYTINLTNSGPSDVTGVQVKDILPTGLLYDVGNSIIPVGTYNEVTGIWDLSTVTIPNGTTYTLQIAAQVTPACGEIINTAEIVSSDKSDPDSTINNGN